MRDAILFPMIVVCGTMGELCISRAMKSVGEASGFHPAEIARVVLRALREPWLWTGVSLMALGFFALLGTLSIDNVSFVIPVTALEYVVAAFGSIFFLKEHISSRRWTGLGVIVAGVVLVILSKR